MSRLSENVDRRSVLKAGALVIAFSLAGAKVVSARVLVRGGADGDAPTAKAIGGVVRIEAAAGTNLVRVIMEGTTVGSPAGDIAMPGFAGSLSDTEIATISNDVIGHFDGKTGTVTAADAKSAR